MEVYYQWKTNSVSDIKGFVLAFINIKYLNSLTTQKCCRLKKSCPAFSHETCQWLKFPLNGLRAQSRVRPVVGLLPLASGPACLGMAFPPFLVKQLYRCDSVVISSFVRTNNVGNKNSQKKKTPQMKRCVN